MKLEKVSIWRQKNKSSGIAIQIEKTITTVNNNPGSKREHQNLYMKLDKILSENGL